LSIRDDYKDVAIYNRVPYFSDRSHDVLSVKLASPADWMTATVTVCEVRDDESKLEPLGNSTSRVEPILPEYWKTNAKHGQRGQLSRIQIAPYLARRVTLLENVTDNDPWAHVSD
jgi:hypothetical protein